MDRIPRAMSVGEVGSTRTPQPVSRTTAAIPGRSEATTGTPAAIASHSLFGVVNRWLSVVGWMAMSMTSDEAVQSSSADGGTGSTARTRSRYRADPARLRI